MGNTVRREPVNFDIPASPNYKFLNITNFRGLDVSSNPFELATNTASDCLNVYVDETNTLTTRPRLCKKEFKNANGDFIVPLGGTCIGVYNLHNGYLLHHLIDDKPIMRLFVDGVLKEPVSGDLIPTTQCKHFEHGEEIYLLTGSDYLVIKDNVISKVEGYIPNKSIKTLDGREIDDEPLNILSDEYTISYLWDGLNRPAVKDMFADDVTNTYYDYCDLELSTYPEELLGVYTDNTYLYVGNRNELFYVKCDENFNNKTVIDTGIQLKNPHTRFAMGRDTKSFWYVDYSTSKINYCTITKNDEFNISEASFTANYGFVSVSDDNARLLVRGGGNLYILYNDDLSKTTELSLSGIMSNEQVNGIIVRDRDVYKYYISASEQISVSGPTLNNKIYVATDDSTEFKLFDDLSDIYSNTTVNIYLRNASNVSTLCVITDDATFLYPNYIATEREHITFSLGRLGGVDKDLTYGYSLIPNGTPMTYDIKIYPRLSKSSYILLVNISVPRNNYANLHPILVAFVELTGLIGPMQISGQSNALGRDKFWKWTNNPDAKIFTKHTNTSEDVVQKRQQFLNSILHVRFYNNHWIASGNKYFRTSNNDPTYFPITEYNELGDVNEDITGFNIANDTTLLAYKTHRVYLIQPFTSSVDTTEYSVTESKNTVGNTAIDAPIVTTLTEIPLQINYDGIYGLSQLQNVSAVERIADLMSEPINDRWLNEDDKVIKKAITLNRLYWTYIILPYDDVTKIYLLDNRTNSWYYWELPIKLLTAFTKDNRAEFVDTDGNIYYLTTTDIKNAGFDTQLVTEYYDDGKKLINWFWQSQILPMGTMNYAKRLVNTTFILTDTDTQDGYGLKYNFKVFRKLASSTPEKEITDELNLVRSTTKKTNISKFGFIQLKISNITEESQGTEAEKAYRNNKLRLVGLGLKYVLLEGLIR